MVRLILLALLLSSTLLYARKPIHKQEWYKLEKQVDFKPYSTAFVDSIRDSLNLRDTTPTEHTLSTTLPKRDKAVYRMLFSGLKAGYSIVENNRKEDKLVISGKVMTSKFVSRLYKVRTYIFSVANPKTFLPIFFEQHNNEKLAWDKKPYIRDTWETYDHINEKVYSSKKDTAQLFPAFTNNYATILYQIRNTPKFVIGDTLSYPCYVHDKRWDIKVVVEKKKRVKVKAGKFHTLRLRPLLVGEGGHGFTAKDKMYIWITNDDSRKVVQMRVMTSKGDVWARLEHYEEER